MSFSPFPWLSADAGVIALLGSPPRAYPYGEVPQNVARPYVSWQLIFGSPENYLADAPDIALRRYQFDAWSLTQAQAESVAAAVIAALQPNGHQVSDNGEDRDPETKLYRVGFDFEFWADL